MAEQKQEDQLEHKYNTVFLHLLSRISAGRAGCGTDLAECVLAAG